MTLNHLGHRNRGPGGSERGEQRKATTDRPYSFITLPFSSNDRSDVRFCKPQIVACGGRPSTKWANAVPFTKPNLPSLAFLQDR